MPPKIQSQGFTLVELIIVILLIGILSISVIVRWPTSAVNVNAEAHRVLTDVRYVQALSMATGQRYRWVRLSSSSYQLMNESGVAIPLQNGSNQITLSSGITLSFTNLPNSLIAFSSQGVPYVDAALPGTALSSTALITLTASGVSRSVQILPGTGFGDLQ